MRIYGPNGTGLAAAAPASRRSAAGGFTVTEEETTQAPTSPASLRTIGGIDALIALQGIEDPAERRRRAVKHGFHALDALDELKLGLLAGTLDQSALLRLKAAAAALKIDSGDARLDGVLAEIDLRAEVELAKAGIR
jgi:Class II flagellar assembly regulator